MVEIQYMQLDKQIQDSAKGYIYGESPLLPSSSGGFPSVRTLLDNYSPPNYISFDGQGIDLADQNKCFYSPGDYVGYISNDVSSEERNNFCGESIYITGNFSELSKGITIAFYGDCCTEIDVQYIFPDTTSEVETLKVDGSLFHFKPVVPPYYPGEYQYPSSIKLFFSKTKYPNQFIKISHIKFGTVTIFKKLKGIELLEEINVLSDDLPMNSLNMSIASNEDINFKQDDPINVYSNGRYYGTFYLDDSERTSKNIYSIKALNTIKKLNEVQYKEWHTTLASDRFKKQLEDLTGVKINLNENYGAFGNIPINSCRYALCQYAFACGLMIDGSRGNEVVLKPIPEKITSVIKSSDKRIIGKATFKKSKPITVSKMQYASTFQYKTEVLNFKVPANKRILYYFEEPIEVLDEQPEGVKVFNSSENYVDLIADTEDVALNIIKIGYVYDNIDIVNDFANTTASNEKDFSKLNLRGSLFAENGVGTSLVKNKANDIRKYMRSGGTVTAKIILENEKVGDLIQIETAYDGIKTGIITSMSLSFGYRDIAEIEVLEWQNG